MPVPTAISDLTTVAATNSPQGTETVKGTIDDYFRAGFAFTKQIYDLTLGPSVVLASAATVNIGFAASQNVVISGTTTITSFDSYAEGTLRWVVFNGTLTLTHNAAVIFLPGSANIVTAVGDGALFKSTGGGRWICLAYTRVSGQGVIPFLPLAGGTMTGDITFNNAKGLFGRESGGAARQLIRLGSDNNVDMTVAGGNNLNIFNAAGTTPLWSITNAGIVTMAGKLILKEGTASDPALSFANDGAPDTGFYHISDGVFGITCNTVPTIVFNTGGMVVAGTVTTASLTLTSDERKKKKFERMPAGFVEQLAGIKKSGKFTWKRGGGVAIGVGAQSLEAIFPEAVHTNEKGEKSVHYASAAMVSVVELARELITLKAKIAKLEGAK